MPAVVDRPEQHAAAFDVVDEPVTAALGGRAADEHHAKLDRIVRPHGGIAVDDLEVAVPIHAPREREQHEPPHRGTRSIMALGQQSRHLPCCSENSITSTCTTASPGTNA